MNKKRVLYCGECSYIKSGYGAYSRELLSRLQATGKYEIAELGAFGLINQKEDECITWKYYANGIEKTDPRNKDYSSNPANMSGAWRFEKVLLDFKPDTVITWRDPWVDAFISESPFRNHFNFIWMPTTDSIPIKQEFADMYSRADILLAYNDWSLEQLKKIGLKNVYKSAPPCVNQNVFIPATNKSEHKKSLGIDENSLIVGTVMRNQQRKLFPDLMMAFNLFLDKCKQEDNKELADRTYLYLHTSYPDNSCWDIPLLIKENNLGNKVLMTYLCKNCHGSFISFFQDARTLCPHCNNVSAVMPSVGNGVTDEVLAGIYNIFDVYVQYSTNEGFGIPLIEAAGCGVPVIGVNYSAPEDIVPKLNGELVDVERLNFEITTHAFRAHPKNSHLAQLLYNTLSLPQGLRAAKGFQAYNGVGQHYTWDKTVKVWEECIDRLSPKKPWNAPPNLIGKTNAAPPQTNSHYEFVEWCYINVLQRPDLIDSYQFSVYVHDLNYGVTAGAGKYVPFDRQILLNVLSNKVQYTNNWEKTRCGMLPLENEDFIQYANMKYNAQEQYGDKA